MKLSAMFIVMCIVATGCSNDGGASGESADTTAKIASLQEQIRALESTVSSLRSTMEAADKQLKEEFEKRIAVLEDVCDELNDAIASLPGGGGSYDIGALAERLTKLEGKVASEDSALAAKIEEVKKSLDTKLDKAAVESMLTELKTSLQANISGLQNKVEACESQLTSLNGSIAALKTQIESMQNAVNGKVDKSEYDAFVKQTNAAVQENIAKLAELSALCSGFSSGQTVKGYIDSAVSNLTSSLGNYVLKSTYDSFCLEYSNFLTKYETDKDSIENQMKSLRALIEGLDSGDLSGIGDLAGLTTRLAALEAKAVSLEDVYSKFTTECTQFKSGVNSVIDEALADGGRISAAIEKAIEDLLGDYISTIDDLKRQVDDLTGRVDNLEEQMQDVIGRIQSLVYVPKTSDGKIHVGTTYIAVNDDDENRIEVTPTKKLEYRVSPAELSEKLIELPLEAFSFWQEHVTRAEGDGTDEFRVRNVEAGNGPGEILVTVDNDHDFLYQDLAVALCIKSESKSGVKTEFTSPYTTVVSDGRNIYNRFYLARRSVDGGYETVYGDELISLMLYDDLTSTATLLSSEEYEVVYDNGESIMSLDEAKARFEWEVDLGWKKTGITGAYSNANQVLEPHVVPSNPNENRQSDVSVTLLGSHTSNIGKAISDAYLIELTDGEHTITLRERMAVKLLFCDKKYIVEGTPAIVWNYSKWEAAIGRPEGDYTPYLTQVSYRIASEQTGLSNRYNHLPESVLTDIFSPTAVWEYEQNNAINGELVICNTMPEMVAGTGTAKEWHVQFTVNGYKYNDDTKTLSRIYRNVRPAHLVGNTPILIEASNFTFEAPEKRKITLSCDVNSKSASAVLFYLAVSDHINNNNKKLQYSKDEIDKFFGGDTSNLATSEFLSDLNHSATFATLQSGEHTMPVRIEAMRVEKTDATDSSKDTAYVYPALVAIPNQITPAITSETVFTVPEGATIHLQDGPTFEVVGNVTVKVEED